MLTYGKQEDWTEDIYSMKGDNTGAQSVADFHGTNMGENTAQYPQEVIISCPNKMGRVRASLSGNITLNIQSEWQPMFSGGIAGMANGLMSSANQIVEWGLGATIQQPWMNRKNYKNTQPFSFTLPLNFVATESAKDDVVKPCLALISFLYPRKYSPSDTTNQSIYNKYNSQDFSNPSELRPMSGFANKYQNDSGYSAFDKLKELGSKCPIGFIAKTAQEADKSSIIGSVADLFEVWEIPGPALLTSDNSNEGHRGDVIDIVVGKMFALGNCYLESVNVNFGSSFDSKGFPLSAKVDVKCTCADSVVCSNTGNLLVNEVYDQSEKLSRAVNAAATGISNFIENVGKIITGTMGFWSGSVQVQS